MSLKFYTQKIPLASKFSTQKNTRLSTSIPIYSIIQTLRTKKKNVKVLLTQKNTKGVNFQPQKIRKTSPSCILQVTPLAAKLFKAVIRYRAGP